MKRNIMNDFINLGLIFTIKKNFFLFLSLLLLHLMTIEKIVRQHHHKLESVVVY